MCIYLSPLLFLIGPHPIPSHPILAGFTKTAALPFLLQVTTEAYVCTPYSSSLPDDHRTEAASNVGKYLLEQSIVRLFGAEYCTVAGISFHLISHLDRRYSQSRESIKESRTGRFLCDTKAGSPAAVRESYCNLICGVGVRYSM